MIFFAKYKFSENLSKIESDVENIDWNWLAVVWCKTETETTFEGVNILWDDVGNGKYIRALGKNEYGKLNGKVWIVATLLGKELGERMVNPTDFFVAKQGTKKCTQVLANKSRKGDFFGSAKTLK